MVNVGPGADKVIGCRTVVSRSPFGSLDNVTVNRGSVSVGGWAIDPDTNDPIDIHVYVGATGRAIRADLPRPDVDAVYGRGPNHGFATTMPVSPGTVEVKVFAINTGAGANVLLGSRTVEVGTPFGALEAVYPAGGGVKVRGFAIDPDVDAPIPVHVYVGGVGTAILADEPRPDVAAFLGGGRDTIGFDDVVPGPPGRQQVSVYAINDSGPNKLIATRTVDIRSGSPFGHLDVVRAGPGTIRVAGWVLDPDRDGPIDVHVYVGTQGRAIRADRPRPDVGALYPGYGSVHGFDATIPAPVGLHDVCVYGIDVGPGENSLLDCRMVLVGGDPFGSVDVLRGQAGLISVAGWALDPDTADPIDVHIYVDGNGRAVTANGNRPDIATAYPGYGAAHGFATSIPAGGGNHFVEVYAIDRGLGENRLLVSRTVSA